MSLEGDEDLAVGICIEEVFRQVTSLVVLLRTGEGHRLKEDVAQLGKEMRCEKLRVN